MHWRTAWKCCDEWKVPPQNPVHWQQRRHEKQERTEKPSLATSNKGDMQTSGTCRNNILQYLLLQPITAFLSVLDSCGFIPNDNKGVFARTLIPPLIEIPTNAAQPAAVATGVTWRLLGLNTKMRLWNTGVFYFCFKKTETNRKRLKCLWGCTWGIWG